MRALIDTNVLISYLLLSDDVGAIRTIFHTFELGQFTLLLPEPLLEELVTAVQGKRRLSSRISPGELSAFVRLLRTYAEKVRTIDQPIPAITRDRKDDYLLAYAFLGRADSLVTGDKDLLALRGQVPGLGVVTLAQFVEILTNNELQP
jgi:putative PIN family toxin of toxin-antitoxin system